MPIDILLSILKSLTRRAFKNWYVSRCERIVAVLITLTKNAVQIKYHAVLETFSRTILLSDKDMDEIWCYSCRFSTLQSLVSPTVVYWAIRDLLGGYSHEIDPVQLIKGVLAGEYGKCPEYKCRKNISSDLTDIKAAWEKRPRVEF
jgi:hypothetical protein